MAPHGAAVVPAYRAGRNQSIPASPPGRRECGSTDSAPKTKSRTGSQSRQRSIALPAASATRVATRSYTPWKATTKPPTEKHSLVSLCLVFLPDLRRLHLRDGMGAVKISSAICAAWRHCITGRAAHRFGPELVRPGLVHPWHNCNRCALATGSGKGVQFRLPTMRRNSDKSPRFPFRVL